MPIARCWTLLPVAVLALVPTARPAAADVISEWNARAAEIETAARLPAPFTYRANAIVQSAVYEAVNAITGKYPRDPLSVNAPAGASVEAAVAAASRAALVNLVPARRAAADSAYALALAAIPDDPARAAGIATGERAAAAVLAWSAGDGADAPESYRPRTAPGAYVPTATPVASRWPSRRPWALARPDQFRPGPPPDLASERWARDFAETRALGAKTGSQRTAEQTEIALFWEATTPAIYLPLVRCVADLPGREVTRNARLFALASQAMDDAAIAVFDAKYRYGFWRPVTAIRNGDTDGNPATERDSAWTPLIETPMHPEYPCAHCVLAGVVGAVLTAELGAGPVPRLATTSPARPGVVRSWTSFEDFEREVSDARICDGVHFRNSAEVGAALGRRVGAWSVAHFWSSLAHHD